MSSSTEQSKCFNKVILDACCGGRMFWFNKHHPNAVYIDNREKSPGHDRNRPNHKIQPDITMDNRHMSFEDGSFKLVVWDPPHLIGKPEQNRMIKQYGCLIAETWQSDLKQSFDECWRVLEDYGVLIFKWNDASISQRLFVLLRSFYCTSTH